MNSTTANKKPKGLRRKNTDTSSDEEYPSSIHSSKKSTSDRTVISSLPLKETKDTLFKNITDSREKKELEAEIASKEFLYKVDNIEKIEEKVKRLKEMTATAEAEYDTQLDRDHRAILEKSIQINKVIKKMLLIVHYAVFILYIFFKGINRNRK